MAAKGVIAGVVTAIGGSIAAAIFTPELVKSVGATVLGALSDGVSAAWSWVAGGHSIPGWAILMVSPLALVGVIQSAYAFKGEKEPEPGWMSYVSDVIFGVKWRWKWIGQELDGLWCFCTICDTELVYNDRRDIFSDKVDETKFYCEHCGHALRATLPGAKSHALGTVTREIYRRLRTGEKP